VLPRRTHAVEVLGIGHAQAQGIKCGNVVDIAAAEEMLRHAVDQAERAAGVHVDSVVLSITAGRTASEQFAATVHMRQPVVNDADIERVLAAGSHHSVREGRAVLHSLPIGYALDDNRGVRDPRGMIGARLGVDMHVATTDVAIARNLTLLVERCHIAVEAMVAAPYVSGLAALAEDEADLGAAVVDMGAGTTTLAVFAEGRFTHVDGFTLGGQHVTMDIARGLTTTIADAERLKTLFGAALSGPSDDRDMVTLSAIDADPRDPPRLIPRAQLVRIIRPRVEEILEMVRDKLAASPFAADPRGRVILVGGASQLTGLPISPRISSAGRCASAVRSASGVSPRRRKGRRSQPPLDCSSIRSSPIWSTASRAGRARSRPERMDTSAALGAGCARDSKVEAARDAVSKNTIAVLRP
jgi:cell division protein FtsA